VLNSSHLKNDKNIKNLRASNFLNFLQPFFGGRIDFLIQISRKKNGSHTEKLDRFKYVFTVMEEVV
jgi:hypothetical protein